jgi:hypothetical protein
VTRTIVVYGNCQAEVMFWLLKAIPGLQSVPVAYYSSFEGTGDAEMREAEATIAACSLLLRHPDDPKRPFPRHLLPPDCRQLTFAPLDFNIFWPWAAANPYDLRDTRRPWGYFPYGDRVIIECIERGMAPNDILAYYVNDAWNDHAPKLDRLFEIERHRLAARDAVCDVKIGELILTTFADHRLFWTRNHPSTRILSELFGRLLTLAARDFPALAALDVAEVMAAKLTEQFEAMEVPIHPKVAEHFGLRWYDPGDGFAWAGRRFTYDEYFSEMIFHSARQARRGIRA